ncbi:hypothetical protein SAMN06269185_1527 [Natronoarchaeum philippinense]|uniref:CAAX prenyl protease 2/Lysostaphin resistance protein A-like domain-containing protein n=1 Tax=Natronoarchaeum philippinense TaxID=558529 RepID=A0A285NWZ2_NATPI|nr:type II CAAX endopeptidase family protein [Natronoarchaeum philippinense]SNZ12161.1 hypothetical protein SAMN06269185_1527 [Natronoarchaeum philippinense]
MADWDSDDHRDDDGDWGQRDGDGRAQSDGGDWDTGTDPQPRGASPDAAGGSGDTDATATLGSVLKMSGISLGLVGIALVVSNAAFLLVAVLATAVGVNVLDDLALQLVLSTVLLQGIGFGTAALVYLRYNDLGFEYVRARMPTWNDIKWTIGAFVAGYGLLIAGSLLLTALGISSEGHSIAETASGNPEILLVLIPLSFLLVGPGEELLFRGVIQNAFVDRVGVGGGIVASSAIFVSIHLPNYGWTDGLPTLGVLFVVTMVWGYVYERTDSLFVPAMAHGAFNAVQFAALYASMTSGAATGLLW